MSLLFDELPKSKPVKRMHVNDAGGPELVEMICGHCGHNTGWINPGKTITELKRGLPCPKCN